jgi:hypothetical protein
MSKANTTNIAGTELKKTEIEEAKREGILDAVRDGGRAAVATDTGTTSDIEAAAEAANLRVAPDLNTTFLAPLLDLPAADLSRRLTNEKLDDHIPFENAKGLLALERAGRNRTDYVQVLCKALGVDDPRVVTSAGPAYTNDTSQLTHL